ncbi:hypothetical protein [Microbacterium sp. NPDC096154]|uniref:hypothetical protein n=1 Tax=Microbacterium sp. NPDC096154 TaxID=3155549 RepID=UPI00331DDFCB
MPLRPAHATFALLGVIALLTSCASRSDPLSEAEQNYRDWLTAADDIRRRTVTDDTAATLRRLSSDDVLMAPRFSVVDHMLAGARQTGYRHIVAFRIVQRPQGSGALPPPEDAVTAEACVDATLVDQVDGVGDSLAGEYDARRYARFVVLTRDESGILVISEERETASDICEG